LAIFLDTGVFVAVRNVRDADHGRASDLLERALRGEFGTIYTSDYVIDEAVTTSYFRTGSFALAVGVGRLALESPRVEKLFTGPAEFQSSWERFQRLGKKPMSFTDCVSLTHMERRGVDKIMSFDSGFDGLAARIH
jgi:predicted nucleic acid-binding protein